MAVDATPAAIYNGGMLQTHVRNFDPHRRRPGLPPYVAAMVDGVSADGVSLTMVNTDAVEGRPVLLQAGICPPTAWFAFIEGRTRVMRIR